MRSGARDHLIDHFDDPLAALPDDDPDARRARDAVRDGGARGRPRVDEPVLRMSFLQLEQRRIERELRGGRAGADRAPERAGRARQQVRERLDQ